MAFDYQYLSFGKITFTKGSVSVWRDNYNSRYLPNVPYGVSNATWQGNHITVETESGNVYVYDGFENYSHYWRK